MAIDRWLELLDNDCNDDTYFEIPGEAAGELAAEIRMIMARNEELEKHKSLHTQCDRISLETEAKLIKRLASAHEIINRLTKALQKIDRMESMHPSDIVGVARQALTTMMMEKKDD